MYQMRNTDKDRWRKLTVVAATLSSVTALGIAGAMTAKISYTQAATVDREFARADIKASWQLAYSNIITASAQSSNPTVNKTNMTYNRVNQFTQQVSGTPLNDTSGPNKRQIFYGTGNPVNDAANSPFALTIDTHSDELSNWWARTGFNDAISGSSVKPPQAFRCLVINEKVLPTPSNDARCHLGANSIAAASNNTSAYGFSIGRGKPHSPTLTSLQRYAFLNSAGLTTATRCGANSAIADAPAGRIDIGQEEQYANDSYLQYIESSKRRTVFSTDPSNPMSPGIENGKLSDMWHVSGTHSEGEGNGYMKAMPVITQYAQGSATQAPYALSEIALYIESYGEYWDSAAGKPSYELELKMYFVLSRSECGVKRVTDAALPNQRAVFPPMPGGPGLSPYVQAGGAAFLPAAQPLAAPGSPLATPGSPLATPAAAPSTTTVTVTSSAAPSPASSTPISGPTPSATPVGG